jgi:hypothetical protein
MYITLVADGAGGGWAFGPRPHGTPAQVQPAELPHVTLPLCDPHSHDALTVARATITLDAAASAAFTVSVPPPQAEQHHPAVLLATLPANRLAIAIGVFGDTDAAYRWWAAARIRLDLPGISIGVYPLISEPTRRHD